MPDLGRVVDIASAARLSYRDLQLVLEREGAPTVTIPVEDIGIVLLGNAPITVTSPLLAALAEQGAALVVADARHMPAGLRLPLAGSTLHAATLRSQIEASVPRRKQVWQTIIRAKVAAQAALLKAEKGTDKGLLALSRAVRSDDAGNVEAQAARLYFTALFGRGFKRDHEAPGLNALLNYGYAVLRAAVARALVGAGLHPALGVHHRSQYDAFALADDAMEPLRPLVDRLALGLRADLPEGEGLPTPVRRAMVALLTESVGWEGKRYPLTAALPNYAAALRRRIAGDDEALPCPEP